MYEAEWRPARGCDAGGPAGGRLGLGLQPATPVTGVHAAKGRRARVVAAALLLAAAWPHVARADAVAAFRDFGLLGTWSPDCAKPPSRDNPRVRWSVSQGVVVHWVSFDGRQPALVDTVGAAEILGEDRIRVVSVRGGQAALVSVWEMSGDRLWAVRSEEPGGRVFYDRGMELATGRPSVPDERCGTPTS